MYFSEYGDPAGQPVIYFHGVPGSPDEAAPFAPQALEHGLRLICFDRFAIEHDIAGASYYRHIAQAITAATHGAALDFISFSLGSHVALATSRHLPGTVKSLHLISAVAPLEQGNFLDQMAGKAVFSLARNRPSAFRLLARGQALLASRLPGALLRMLFASSQGQDKALATQPQFTAAMTQVLAQCFAHGTQGYVRDIEQYLAPWPDDILAGPTPIHLWHGSEDNWSPVGMAEYLASSASGPVAIDWLQGFSHYSCLYEAAPRICRLLSCQ